MSKSKAALDLWNVKYNRNLINAFRELQEEGVLEIITCGATHGFLPLISTKESRRAQIKSRLKIIKNISAPAARHLAARMRLRAGRRKFLKEAGIEYFIGDSHAILYGDPRPRFGVHAPVLCPNGVAVFARDVETSQQVWSAEVGYPGNAVYREFYRDIGWDLPLELFEAASARRRKAPASRFEILPHHRKNRFAAIQRSRMFRLGRAKKPPRTLRILSPNVSSRLINCAKISARIRRSSRRLMTPSFTVTGGLKVRSSSIFCFASFISTKRKSKPLRPAIFSTRAFRFKFSSRRLHLGRKRLLQSLAQRRQFVDVSVSARRRTKNDRFGESLRISERRSNIAF
jgi:hypothetical protein